MRRKMDMLERAHGLLCNVPGDSTSAEDAEVWHRLRREWVERYGHLISDDATRRHNRLINLGNDAIADYERRTAVVCPPDGQWKGVRPDLLLIDDLDPGCREAGPPC